MLALNNLLPPQDPIPLIRKKGKKAQNRTAAFRYREKNMLALNNLLPPQDPIPLTRKKGKKRRTEQQPLDTEKKRKLN